MTIHLATDHAGFEDKEVLKTYLTEKGYNVVDHGVYTLDPEDDYPDFIYPCAKAVSLEPQSKGIIFGGSGQGEAMVANKVSGIRAVVYYGGNEEIITLSREHNDANILSLAGRFLSSLEVIRVSELWLTTPFSGDERHIRRIEKIHAHE
jgi:ribose 5-phosphate isomerase B